MIDKNTVLKEQVDLDQIFNNDYLSLIWFLERDINIRFVLIEESSPAGINSFRALHVDEAYNDFVTKKNSFF